MNITLINILNLILGLVLGYFLSYIYYDYYYNLRNHVLAYDKDKKYKKALQTIKVHDLTKKFKTIVTVTEIQDILNTLDKKPKIVTKMFLKRS
jgi:hypothetical protein